MAEALEGVTYSSEVQLPTVDLADWWTGESEARAAIAADVDDALRSWGFLLVSGHGVAGQLARELRATMRSPSVSSISQPRDRRCTAVTDLPVWMRPPLEMITASSEATNRANHGPLGPRPRSAPPETLMRCCLSAWPLRAPHQPGGQSRGSPGLQDPQRLTTRGLPAGPARYTKFLTVPGAVGSPPARVVFACGDGNVGSAGRIGLAVGVAAPAGDVLSVRSAQ